MDIIPLSILSYGPQLALRLITADGIESRAYACSLLQNELNEKNVNVEEKIVYVKPSGLKETVDGQREFYYYDLAICDK